MIGCDVMTPAVTSHRDTSHDDSPCPRAMRVYTVSRYLVVTLRVSPSDCLYPCVRVSVAATIFSRRQHTIPYWNQPLQPRAPRVLVHRSRAFTGRERSRWLGLRQVLDPNYSIIEYSNFIIHRSGYEKNYTSVRIYCCFINSSRFPQILE